MPGTVHAIVVVRPDGRTSAAYHLRRTFASLAAGSRRPDAVTLVVCGTDPAVEDALEPGSLPDPTADGRGVRVIRLGRRTRFAAAVASAALEPDPRSGAGTDADLLWLLAQDTAPEPEALARMAGQLELSPTLAFVAPKLVRDDRPERIVSLGVSMTRAGASVELAAGDLDQGQRDGITDVLGSDIRAVLVRGSVLRALRGIDPALRDADEGLDLAVAARLMGGRVALVPGTRVAVSGDGVAGLPFPDTGSRRRMIIARRRAAQLHRRLTAAHPLLLIPAWFSLPFVALGRTIAQLVMKDPGRIAGEWAATILAMVRLAAIARGRRRLRRHRSVPWSRIGPLRVSTALARERAAEPEEPSPDSLPRAELHFFGGGGAWLVLAMGAVALAAFPALLAWPALGGGALQPLRDTVVGLWADAAYGLRPTGWNVSGPADPFAAIVAVIGSLWPFSPSRALVLLWLAALPLAALGGWFAATRITDRPVLRIMAGVAWALAPTFLVALTEGVPTGVIVHLLLPWLVFAGAVAHRSWVPAASASLLAAAVIAAAPSLAPALAVVVIAGLIAAAVGRSGASFVRMLWVPVPTIVTFVPVVWAQVHAGNPWGLIADPGAPIGALGPAVDTRLWVVLGFPASSGAGWAELLPALPLWGPALLLMPIALLAASAAAMPRWPVGLAHLGLIVLGVATAVAATGIAVRFDGAVALAVWPGAGLSLAWWGVVGAATLTLDQIGRAELRRYRRRAGAVSASAAVVCMVALLALAVPALTATARGTAALTNGPTSTLPAYVEADSGGQTATGTIILTPEADGSLAARVVWGGSETLGAHSTVLETRQAMDAASSQLAATAAALVTSTSPDAVTALGEQGIAFVLLAPGADGPAAEVLRLEASTALDQRDDLDAVGATERGDLWRVTSQIAPRPPAEGSAGGLTLEILQIAVVVIALLLAAPTGRSRARARRHPRIVGLTATERAMDAGRARRLEDGAHEAQALPTEPTGEEAT